MNTSYIKNLKTPIAIIGLGKSGTSAFQLLKEFGFSGEQLICFDEKNLLSELSSPSDLIAKMPQTIVVSPGVSLQKEWIQKIISNGAHLTSEVSLAASLITSEVVIGVTGSVAKSTVVSLLSTAAKSIDENAFVGGNIGIPFCEYALGLVRGKIKSEIIILELSSYQLENCNGLSLSHSIVSYLSANHLERYPDLESYYKTKLSITNITKNLCVFNKNSLDASKYSAHSKCAYQLINSETSRFKDLILKTQLIGQHNKDNFAMAAEIAFSLGWSEKSLEAMALFKGLQHRLEFVNTANGVHYINDSKATAIDSVLVAVNSCLANLKNAAQLFLLIGGKDKNLPWQELAILSLHVQIIPVFFGECGSLAKQKSGLVGESFEKLGSAINYCQNRAKTDDIVLLSPGGTSLDEFKNFEQRGDFFKSTVLAEIS